MFLLSRSLIPPHFIPIPIDYIRQASNHSTDIGLQRMEHDNRSADIGPQTMVLRPSSIHESSSIVMPGSPIFSLTEHYVINRAISGWDGPKYTT